MPLLVRFSPYMYPAGVLIHDVDRAPEYSFAIMYERIDAAVSCEYELCSGDER